MHLSLDRSIPTLKVIQGLLWAMMGAAIVGGVFLIVNRPQNPDITIILPTPTIPGPVQVYVTGAVGSPGLYTLEPGSRVNDLLDAAQGGLPNADLEAINLARRLSDGEQVHVPRMGESPPAKVGSTEEARLNINTASAEMLMALPGIGVVKAQAIIDYRSRVGRFQRVDELLKVPGVGQITYEGLKELVAVE